MRKWDLPEPKNPEIQMPILPVGSTFLPRSQCLKIPFDELAEMPVQFARDDELVQFLPDGAIVELVGLHDPVDRPENVAFEKVLDKHVSLGSRDEPEGSVVVAALDFAEQAQGLPVV